MEANECDNAHLDSDVLLPPRKRLLAGLKRQSPESSDSPESSSSIPLNEYETRLQTLLNSYKDGSRMSPEEIADAARSAAYSAAKAAAAARATAEEKAAAALKAVAAAKDAMSLFASFAKGKGIAERQLRKNNLKKHLGVQNIHTNRGSDDEELTRKLHGAISNSSPRVLKHDPGPEAAVKHSSGVLEEISGVLTESQDETIVNGRNRGRTEHQNLPISFCSLKDRENPRDELKESNSTDTSVPIEPAQTWKCQDFKVPHCIEPNKVMQS